MKISNVYHEEIGRGEVSLSYFQRVFNPMNISPEIHPCHHPRHPHKLTWHLVSSVQEAVSGDLLKLAQQAQDVKSGENSEIKFVIKLILV